MSPVLVTFLLALLFFTTSVVLINYIIKQYEKERLNELTSQIKEKNSPKILSRTQATRSFSTFDLNASISRSKNVAKQFFDKSGGVASREQLVRTLESSRNALKGVIGSVGGLFKPMQSPTDSYNKHHEQKAENEEVNIATDEEIANEQYNKDTDTFINKATNPTNATLDYLSESLEESENLEKIMENKILAQLKAAGTSNYDIWLILGDHYAKTKQPEKAKEVYALVLKHAKDKSPLKENARNRLIGIS
jgi:hypothetical protein